MFSKVKGTVGIILVSSIVYLSMLILFSHHGVPHVFFERFGYVPGKGIYRIFTSVFIHSGFIHLFFNMSFLYLMGSRIERSLGTCSFLFFYMLSAVISTGIHMLFMPPDVSFPLVGASGAVSAVAGVYCVFYPRDHVSVLFLKKTAYSQIALNARLLCVFWFVLQCAWLFSKEIRASVAVGAHIGGFLFGVLWALAVNSLTKTRRAGAIIDHAPVAQWRER
jgi:membrane associated rhomboid family serine protease